MSRMKDGFAVVRENAYGTNGISIDWVYGPLPRAIKTALEIAERLKLPSVLVTECGMPVARVTWSPEKIGWGPP